MLSQRSTPVKMSQEAANKLPRWSLLSLLVIFAATGFWSTGIWTMRDAVALVLRVEPPVLRVDALLAELRVAVVWLRSEADAREADAREADAPSERLVPPVRTDAPCERLTAVFELP